MNNPFESDDSWLAKKENKNQMKEKNLVQESTKRWSAWHREISSDMDMISLWSTFREVSPRSCPMCGGMMLNLFDFKERLLRVALVFGISGIRDISLP